MPRLLRSATAVVTLAVAFPFATLAAQAPAATPAQAHAHEDEGHAIAWKALDAYHTVMAASWHPAKKSGDVAPFRAKANELVSAARALAAEPVPAACGGAARTGDVQALVRASEAAAKAAGTAGMAATDVTAALKVAHDRFHVLEEACSAKPARR